MTILAFLLSSFTLMGAPVVEPADFGQDFEDEVISDDIIDLGALEEEVSLFADETVYGASRYAQKKSDAPSSISVLTDEDIKNHGWRNLTEAIRSLPGFYSSYGRQYHQLGVRGFSRPGDYNSRILLLVNGQRMNENIFGSAGLGNDFAVDMDLVKRIEVIRGPSASVYGTSAFFAVINVQTKTGEDIDGLEVSAGTGSFETHKGRLTFGAKEENTDVLVSASAMNSGGQTHYYEEYDDSATNNGLAVNNDRERTRQHFGSFKTGDFSLQVIDSIRMKHFPTAAYETEFNDSRAADEDRHQALDIKYNKETETGKNLLGRVYYNRYTYNGFFPFDYGAPDGVVLNSDHSKGELWGTEFQLTQSVDNHILTYGADFRQNIHQDQINGDPDGSIYLDDRRSEQIWALYFQGEFKVGKNLVFNAGVRHDDYETYGGTTNPRMGFIFKPETRTTWKLLYGEAFKAPSAFERYYNDDGESSKANPDLEPEEIETFELVYEKVVNKSTNFMASVYNYKINNLISQQEDASDGLFFYDNLDEVTSTGVELEVIRKLEKGMELRVGGSWQNTVDETTDLRLTNSPKHLGHLNFSMPLNDVAEGGKDRYTAGFEFLFVGERKTNADEVAGSYGVTNISFTGHKVIEDMDVTVNIYNLFDRDYSDPASEELVQDMIYQDGRAFSIKLTTKF
jgi:iron complex outermembrane receptor protein